MSATVTTPAEHKLVGVRRISTDDLRWALRQGWNDFKEKRGDLVFVAVLYPLIGLIAAAVALNDVGLPLFFPLVAGISIFGPAAASGFYELAKRREEGRESHVAAFLRPALWPQRFNDPDPDDRAGRCVSALAGGCLRYLRRYHGAGFPRWSKRAHSPGIRHARGMDADCGR